VKPFRSAGCPSSRFTHGLAHGDGPNGGLAISQSLARFGFWTLGGGWGIYINTATAVISEACEASILTGRFR
jgi:hypothetical protein